MKIKFVDLAAQNLEISERVARLHDPLGDFANVDRPSLLQGVREVASLQKLHHDVRRAGLENAGVQNLRDVLTP